MASLAERAYSFLNPNPDNITLTFLSIKRGKRLAFKELLMQGLLNTAKNRELESTIDEITKEERRYEDLLRDDAKERDLSIRKIDEVGAFSIVIGSGMIGVAGKFLGWY